jgi:uncharacterized alpha/beta hydrolase family protein
MYRKIVKLLKRHNSDDFVDINVNYAPRNSIVSLILKICIIIVLAGASMGVLLGAKDLTGIVQYELAQKDQVSIRLSLVNPQVKSVTADPANRVALRIEVRDKTGKPVPKALVLFSVKNRMGEIQPSKIRTDMNGQLLVDYIPPSLSSDKFKDGKVETTVTAKVANTTKTSSVAISLRKVPVLFVHGYQTQASIFDTLKDFFSKKGYDTDALTYNSSLGVVSSAKELEGYIKKKKLEYISKGIQVSRFTLVAHSMGGLVARYYTCSEAYINNQDVSKLFFLAVPHMGSPWASLGAAYYDDQGIRDLVPENPLFTQQFPAMINKGLNHQIQTANIIVEYDEVVNPESASLDEWGIKTEIYNVGESNFTMSSLLDGSIIEGANHKKILNNKKIYERMETLLDAELPYPQTRK